MIRYLSGASNPPLRAVAKKHDIGLLVTIDTRGYMPQVPDFPFWAVDNGCFNHPEREVGEYLSWLETIPPTGLFAPAMDVVGNAKETLRRSMPQLSAIRQTGWPVAFVAQDGIDETPIPWNDFDVLFIGGSTVFKLGEISRRICKEAKYLGKKIHMGRVNSYRRLKIAQEFGCDTVDGTFLAFGPGKNLPRLIGWLDRLRKETEPCYGPSDLSQLSLPLTG